MKLPDVDFDPFEEGITDPYPIYERIREAGPVVRTARGFLAVGRFDDVRRGLSDHETFSSSFGRWANEAQDKALSGSLLMTDPPRHTELRKIMMRPLGPASLKAMRGQIQNMAAELVADLCKRGTVDALEDFATILPVNIVTELVGLPEAGRVRIATWSKAVSDSALPPPSELAQNAMPIFDEWVEYLWDPTLPEKVRPDSWAAELEKAVAAGEITRKDWYPLLSGYVLPAVDTTAMATLNLVYLLARHPDQWRLLRDRTELIPRAVNESMRLESTVQQIARASVRDAEIDGVAVPSGSTVLFLTASANRDPRHYNDPDSFDITRDSGDQLSFGYAAHICLGMNIAKMEMIAILEALVRRVNSIEVLSERRSPNPIIRNFSELTIKLS